MTRLALLTGLFALTAHIAPGSAEAAPESATPQLCVTNESDETLNFTVETRDGVRRGMRLDPAAYLCAPGPAPDGGVVSVFVDESHLEGCSRLVPGGASEALRRFASFDRCRWASHD
ncbi:hypothetical protein [Profundibacterium mesophilum]|nr:hypothetical protein [Profundibacterium mesophilum]